MTKKEFKERCSFHIYKGVGYYRTKTNVIFFDWQQTNEARGFKYAVAADIENCTKADLFKYFFNWVVNQVELPYFVRYRIAQTDAQRFKIPISLNF